MNRILLLVFVLVAMISVPCLAARKSAMGQMPPAVVSVTKVAETTQQPQVAAVGSLSAFEGVVIRPEIAGKVTKIFFKSGDEVKAGDNLIEINPDILQADVEQAKAQLHLSTLDYQRAAKLFKTNAVSEADLDKTRATMESNTGQLNGAQAKLNQTLIKAPFAGRLGLRQVSVGDYLNIGQNLVNLEQLTPIRIDFSVPETYLSKIAADQQVIVTTNAYPGETFTGKVYAYESLLDRNTRSIDIRAKITNDDKKLLPGMFVNVKLLLGAPEKVLVVPQSALIYDEDGAYVYLVDGKIVKKHKVTVVSRTDTDAIISNGLKAGDVVVSDGALKLSDNAPIMIRPAEGK